MCWNPERLLVAVERQNEEWVCLPGLTAPTPLHLHLDLDPLVISHRVLDKHAEQCRRPWLQELHRITTALRAIDRLRLRSLIGRVTRGRQHWPPYHPRAHDIANHRRSLAIRG